VGRRDRKRLSLALGHYANFESLTVIYWTVAPRLPIFQLRCSDPGGLSLKFRPDPFRPASCNHKPVEEKIVSKVLVLYYSSYGHIEAMANAVAEGARQAGAHVDIKRVPELVPEEIARKSHYKLDQAAPIATVGDLAAYDAIVIGAGTRFGRMSSQMANFLDQAGGLWARGALHGKVGGAFTSTATQHGGQEMTLFSIIANLLHFGMVIVGLDYGYAGQMRLDEVTGGAPYGATTIAGGDGARQPTASELDGARYQGRKIAETANKLHG
jgi:NAD(P)H dehydrogenase (quinone)